MKEIIAAIMIASGSLQTPSLPSNSILNSIQEAIIYHGSISIGYCSKLPINGDEDILFGAYTTAPENVKGFVNIGNVWCGIQLTGEKVDCPAPVKDCPTP